MIRPLFNIKILNMLEALNDKGCCRMFSLGTDECEVVVVNPV
jgi:hypothetical protein